MEAPPIPNPANKQPKMTEGSGGVKAQEETVRKFATFLSSDTKGAKNSHSHGLSSLLSESVADDAVILTLPALDLRYSENSDGTQSPLPKIGEKKNIQGEDVAQDVMESTSRPSMTASVLTSAGVDETVQSQSTTSSAETRGVANHTKSTSWTKSTLVYASHALATNLTDFFSNLIDSRVKAWTLLLLRHSLSTGDTESRARLLGMLATSISVQQAETTFKTLPMPTSAAGQRKEADVILPLLFEVSMQLTIQDKPSTIKLLAPGTISADFAGMKASEGDLKKVAIKLDTGVMLSSMIDQARLIVFKAVANVTKAKLPPSMSTGTPLVKDNGSVDISMKEKPSSRHPVTTEPSHAANVTRLSGFRSSLGLSTLPATTTAASPTLQKARNSALRLNSILLGKPDKQGKPTQLGLRKGRSIQWSSPAQMPAIPAVLSTKKQRMAENAAKLTSIKSFGRPHGGDFGSGPRNATFGEYGQGVRMWGRDGRMAHHPLPMQSSMGIDHVGLTGIAERNATFDLAKVPTVSSKMGTASALPRTATGLENWLLKTSTSSHHR